MLPSLHRSLWSVSALLRAVSLDLESNLGGCRVIGEISALSMASSGHVYFSLKDEEPSHDALIRCAMFRRHAAMAGFQLRNGQRVEIRGRLTIYEPRGDFQMVVESIQLAGQGSLLEEFIRLKTRLQNEGLFDASRKRAIPSHPRFIGVITSLAGSVLHDIANTIRRRAPHIQIIIYPSPVQGREAAQQLIQALQLAIEHQQAQLIILARGGGSIEDLWAFNDEGLVRAIAQCPLPVVAGIGHETDITLCDFVADLRAATPTAAAELTTPDRSAWLLALDEHAAQLKITVRQRLDREAQRLDLRHLHILKPSMGLARMKNHWSQLQHQLRLVWTRQIMHQAQTLQRLQSQLEAQNPRNILQKGYAWIESADGKPIVSAQELTPHQSITVQWADGQATTKVEKIHLTKK